VAALARLPGVANGLGELLGVYRRHGVASREYAAADGRFREYLVSYVLEAGYKDLLLVAPDGDLVFALRRTLQRAPELAWLLDRARTLRQTEISDFQVDPVAGGPSAFVAAPVLRDDVVLGVIAVQINNEEVYGIVNDYTGLGETGETTVASVVGDRVMFVTPVRHDPGAAFRRTVELDSSIAQPTLRAVKGAKGYGVVVDYRGRETVAAWQYLPSMRWGMVVKIDTAEAFAPVARQRNVALVIGGVVLVLVVPSALLVAWSISGPIVALTEGVRKVAGRDLTSRVPVARADEIGELGRAFNRMAGELQDLYATMEEKVHLRTRELEASNAELARARDAAEVASRAKSLFLATMSHELRTPLNAIIGYSEILVEEAEEAEEPGREVAPDLRKILGAAKHLLTLIDDILDLSAIEAGTMDVAVKTFDLAQLVQEELTAVGPLADKNKNTVTASLDESLGAMRADRAKVRQCLRNLLSNACKFTEGGTVALEVRRAPTDGVEWITVRVADTGIGMTPAQLATLFQPFTQVDPSYSRKYGGTGLGLTITRRFCEMMGGEVRVESEPGRGTTVTVRLPVGPTAAPGAEPEPASAPREQRTADR
jgi:signal transduction histidine kinase